jgi:hypothetical protein
VAERVRVREVSNQEGTRLLRTVRRSTGSVVTWRRAQMVLLSARAWASPRSYPAVMPGAPYYAEAFSPRPGRCFRLATQDGQGGPMHCPQSLVWRCTFRARDASTARREAGG